MIPKTQIKKIVDLGQFKQGLNTRGDFDTLAMEESPDCRDVTFAEDSALEKRHGREFLNTTATGASDWGFGLFNFSSAPGVQKLIAKFGTTIYKMDDLDGTMDSLITAQGNTNMHCAQSRSNLIICGEDVRPVLSWNGEDAAASVMNSKAPRAKYPIDWEGYTMLGYTTGQPRRFYYEDNTAINSGEWEDYFTVQASTGDEITGWGLLKNRLYVMMKNSIHRVSYLGGSPLFDINELITITGAVPRTIKNISLPNGSEVLIFLNWQKRIVIFDGTSIQFISDSIEPNNGGTFCMNNINHGGIRDAHATIDWDNNLYILFLPIGGSASISHAIALNFKTMALFPYYNQTMHSAVSAQDSSGRKFFIGAGYNGHAHTCFKGNTDAGGSISAFADGGGGKVEVTSNNHKLESGAKVVISGTTNYNGTFTISDTAENTFEITDTWVADDATGSFIVAIDDYYISPKIGAARGLSLKKPRKIVFYFEAVAKYEMALYERLNFDRAWAARATNLFMYNKNDDFLGIDFKLGTSTLGSSKTKVKNAFDIPSVNNLYQYKITSDKSVLAPWKLRKTEFIEDEPGVGASYENTR